MNELLLVFLEMMVAASLKYGITALLWYKSLINCSLFSDLARLPCFYFLLLCVCAGNGLNPGCGLWSSHEDDMFGVVLATYVDLDLTFIICFLFLSSNVWLQSAVCDGQSYYPKVTWLRISLCNIAYRSKCCPRIQFFMQLFSSWSLVWRIHIRLKHWS